MDARPRIGISACIVGEPVRYSGGHCRDDLVMSDLAPHVDLVPMCPEVESGLGAPRESMRLVGSPQAPRLVGGNSGRDETPRLVAWSRERAEAMTALHLDGFILKKGSPTCGLERVRVYPKQGTRPLYQGVGVFARELLARHPRLALEEEGRLRDAGLREHFATRVFASARWRAFAADTPDGDALRAFHMRNELLARAHDERALPRLARLSASEERRADYGSAFLETLARPPTRASQTRVLERLLLAARRAGARERGDLRSAVDEFARGLVPLAVPARLLLHDLRRARAPEAEQTWFAPWPIELRLRTQILREPRARRGVSAGPRRPARSTRCRRA